MKKSRKSFVSRIKITKNGKASHRRSLGHSRANKSPVELTRRKKSRGLVMRTKTLKNYH
jgi:hypothetical protein